MSLESLAIALHHSKAKGTAKLVLIGIANHDGDGGAWPALSTLAKYAGVDRRNVQRAIDQLESLGEVRRIRGAGGDHSTADHRRPNLYRFLLACPEGCDHTRNHRMPRMSAPIEITERDYEPDGVAAAPPGGDGVAAAPPGGESATWWGGGSATQTIHLTQQQLKETDPAYRARESNEDALARDDHRAANAGRALCGHDAIPETGTCVYACRTDFNLRASASA